MKIGNSPILQFVGRQGPGEFGMWRIGKVLAGIGQTVLRVGLVLFNKKPVFGGVHLCYGVPLYTRAREEKIKFLRW